MAKVGRPKSDNPKGERLTVRFTDAQVKRLESYAERLGVTKSKVMSDALEVYLKKEEKKLQKLGK